MSASSLSARALEAEPLAFRAELCSQTSTPSPNDAIKAGVSSRPSWTFAWLMKAMSLLQELVF